MQMSLLQKVLRTIAAAAQIPVIILLILFVDFSLFCIGWIVAEGLNERRFVNYHLGRLIDKMRSDKRHIPQCIEDSGLLLRQKDALLELTRHPEFNKEMLLALEDNLIEEEQSHYDSILMWTGLVSKLAPMAGLLGTLIPLGPGIIALGNGDTYTLSSSLLTAFDTTIAGLIAAGICLTIHTVRSRWYKKYMVDLETLADCVVEMETEL